MKAVVIVDGDTHELQDVPVPEPVAGEIRIRVEASGICGTDLSIMHGLFPSGAGRPLIMGHEFAGVVDAVGEGVTDFARGDRVAADPNLHCGRCEWCQRNAYNLCVEWEALGITLPGALAEYVCLAARYAVRLPDSVSTSAGALIEPLSCAVHAFNLSNVRRDATMVIYGGGMMGLTSLALARRLGHEVHVVEIHEERRRIAIEMGATEAVETGDQLTRQEFDYVLEATGVPSAVEDAFTKLRTRGTFMQLGVTPADFEMKIRPHDIFQRELRIIGSFSVADSYPDASELILSLAPSLEKLVTHRFRLEQFGEALAAMSSPGALKVHIEPQMSPSFHATNQGEVSP